MVVNRRSNCDLCSYMRASQRSALQTLHKVSSKAREQNYFQGGPTHDWVSYYEQHIESDRSCLNEWHAMDSLESRRPPSPDSVRTKPRQRDETEKVIRSTLKEIMMSVDLDEVTSKYIRNRLEEDLDMDLGEFKSFIDQEMLIILGQMDAPTEIFEHVYLGSEWNASNFEELQKNGVGHILNVTREIDNFFPGMFDYLNIRVYDDEKTDLLKYWDNTFKYITKAKNEGSKVLVHCKMGVSRSASVVIAYAMKAYNWGFEHALKHVKEKRTCIKPNTSFIAQLETYQGILDAMKNKEKLQRSKSETNLKSPELVNKGDKRAMATSEQSAIAQSRHRDQMLPNNLSGHELKHIGARPKSWSPDVQPENNLLLERSSLAPVFLSLENLSKEAAVASVAGTSPEARRKSASCPPENARNVLMPLNNGQSYSVSPNQIVHICKKRSESLKPSIKHRIHELQSHSAGSLSKKLLRDKRHMALPLETQAGDMSSDTHIPPMLTAKLVKKEIWDPGEKQPTTVISYANGLDTTTTTNTNTTNHPSCKSCDSPQTLTAQDASSVVWTSSTVLRQSVPLLDNNSERSVENRAANVSCKDSVHKTVPEVFCSKTVLGVIASSSNNNKVVPASRKDGDLFSNQLDRVFEREERKQQRCSIVAAPVTPCTPDAAGGDESVRECPSRQSSWSSYDSAVVLGYQGESRDAPSRHSSWGSGDTRALPSRNSSWGSYDMRPPPPTSIALDQLEHSSSSGLFAYDRDEIPWYPGTVRRTKQKLEASKEAGDKRTGADTKAPPPDFGDAVSGQPHKSPSTETLTSDYAVSVMSEADAPCEAYNTGLLHYTSSPDLCDTKKESHQGSAALASEHLFYSNNAISKQIDIVNDNSDKYRSARFAGSSRLSVSAPETSSLSLMPTECITLSSCSASSILGADDCTTRATQPDNAGSVIYTAQCSSVKKHKNYLENLHKVTDFMSSRNLYADNAHSDADSNSATSCVSGIVQSLKKEFEAKTTSAKPEHVVAAGDTWTDFECGSVRFKSKGSSLPSSPINSTYAECRPPVHDDSNEDVSVKELVGKYEIVGSNLVANNNRALASDGPTTTKQARCVFDKMFSNNQNKNMRYSCIEVLADESGDKMQAPMLISAPDAFVRAQPEPAELAGAKRPPGGPLPSVVVATVVKAANKKQKFARKDTHNCLNIKPRNNNPVYNTM